jgi:hypothetical protein
MAARPKMPVPAGELVPADLLDHIEQWAGRQEFKTQTRPSSAEYALVTVHDPAELQLEEVTMSLDEEYPKTHTNRMAALRRLLAGVPGLEAQEEIALSLNEMADKAEDLVDIMNRLLNERHTPAELGELLIAFELTTEQIRGHSDVIDGKLYDIGDKLAESDGKG